MSTRHIKILVSALFVITGTVLWALPQPDWRAGVAMLVIGLVLLIPAWTRMSWLDLLLRWPAAAWDRARAYDARIREERERGDRTAAKSPRSASRRG